MSKELREKIRTDIREVYGDEWESAVIRIKNYSEIEPFSIKLIFAAERYGSYAKGTQRDAVQLRAGKGRFVLSQQDIYTDQSQGEMRNE